MSSSTLAGFTVHVRSRDESSGFPSAGWQVVWVCLWLAPNCILRLLARQIYHPVGYLNLDLLLLGALALFLSPRWAAVFIASAMATDALEGLARTWYFGPSDLIEATRYVFSLPPIRLVSWSLVLFCVFGGLSSIAFAVRRRTNRRLRAATCATLLLLAASSVTVDFLWGRHPLASRDTLPRFLLTRVPETSLYKQWGRPGAPGNAGNGQVLAMDSASAHALALIPNPAGDTKPNIVEAVIESWGQDRTGIIDQNLESVYRRPEIAQRYRIFTGTVPFHGPTVSAELRELCNSNLGFEVLRIRSAAALSGCLPARLSDDGYSTEAIHGYIGGLFGRYRWYPLLGFQRSWFENGLHDQGLTNCAGVFPGICDRQVARWIGDRLTHASGPLFEYWMTLNSHLPVPASVSGLNPVSCDSDPQLKTKEAECAWFKLEYQVHSSIADIAARRDLPPTVFILVGDHAPPFSDPDLHDRFSTGQVPYLILVPRNTIQRGLPQVARASLVQGR